MKKILIATIVSVMLMIATIILSYIPFIKEVLDTPVYTAYQINDIEIYQNNFLSYDLNITFKNDENYLYEHVEIYISSNQHDLSEETKINYEIIDDKYFVDNLDIPSRGDYFITISFMDQDVIRQTSLQITFPKMSPKIFLNNGLNHILFEVDGQTSWSSFIDPEGINVYKSSQYTFDENAILIEENMRITEQEYLDVNSNSEQPYYYIQFVSKSGRVIYTSSALFSETTQENFNARFVTDFSGVTYLELTGSIYGPEIDNSLAVRDIALRVGNYPDTTMIENTYDGDNNKIFKFLIDIENLLDEGSNDLVFFYNENGTMFEASVNTDEFDISSIQTKVNGSIYTLSNPTALVLNRNYDITYTDLSASFIESDGVVYFKLSGNAYLNDASKVTSIGLKIKGMDETFTQYDIDDATFTIQIDLTTLESSNNWQDITFILEEDGIKYRVNLPSDEIDKNELIINHTHYEFESWNNQLKIHKYIEE